MTSSAPPLSTREHLAWIARLWRPHLGFAAGLLVLTLVSSAIAISYPLAFKLAIDAITAGDLGERVLTVEGILLLIVVGRLVAGFYPGFRAWMNNIIEKRVRERVFHAVLTKDHTFFNAYRTGDLVTRLTDDIGEYPRIAWFACSGVFRFIDSATKFAFCVTAMLLLDAQLAIYAMLPVPAMLYVFYLARKQIGSTYQKQQQAVSQTNDLIESALDGVRIVKAFNSQAGQQRRLDGILEKRVGIQFRLSMLFVMVHELDHIVARVGQVIVLAVGGLRVMDGTLSLGTLMALYVYLDMLLHPMMDLPNLFVTARQAFVSIDREQEVIDHPGVVRRGTAGGDSGPIASVELEDVTLGYDAERPVLDGVSLKARQGQTVAIVGPVGCGKTTVLRLLAGLLPPGDGVYRVNGKPHDDWEWSALQKRVGYVPQESVLFSDPLEENVSFGREVDESWIRTCLGIAQMDDDLAAMPDGLQTPIGRRGTLVSGGQKQRVAIARALAGRPDVLLLDDCTASLDAQNEDRFWAGLRQHFPHATIFLVSHRLATIRRASEVVLLGEGRVVDRGTHAELVERCEAYRELLDTEARREHLTGE